MYFDQIHPLYYPLLSPPYSHWSPSLLSNLSSTSLLSSLSLPLSISLPLSLSSLPLPVPLSPFLLLCSCSYQLLLDPPTRVEAHGFFPSSYQRKVNSQAPQLLGLSRTGVSLISLSQSVLLYCLEIIFDSQLALHLCSGRPSFFKNHSQDKELCKWCEIQCAVKTLRPNALGGCRWYHKPEEGVLQLHPTPCPTQPQYWQINA